MKIKRIKMKKNVFGILVCSVIFFSVIYAPYTTPALDTISLKQISPLTLTTHEAICITCDQNFTDYGFAGAGTPGDPYIIENLNIDAAASKGISVNGTTVNFVIRNCYIEAQSHAIEIKNTGENTVVIENNVCTDSINGIKLVNSPQTTIDSNNCSNNWDTGIHVENCDNSEIKNNVGSYNLGYGIYFRESSHITVYNNTLISNAMETIYVHWSTDSSILNNTCMHSNFYFISVYKSDYIISQYNIFYNSTEFNGVIVSESTNCLFTYNLVQDCQGAVYVAEDTDNIVFHHNTFVNNHHILAGEDTPQASDYGPSNIWYDVANNEGNYWDDHKGEGAYEIFGPYNSSDPYPLSEPTMEPFGEEKASFPFAFILPVLVIAAFLFKKPKKIRVEKSNRR
jgi:parallel beta-helix repeat protein